MQNPTTSEPWALRNNYCPPWCEVEHRGPLVGAVHAATLFDLPSAVVTVLATEDGRATEPTIRIYEPATEWMADASPLMARLLATSFYSDGDTAAIRMGNALVEAANLVAQINQAITLSSATVTAAGEVTGQ